MKLAPGTQITGQVRLVRQLSRGAMGSVWVAEHHGLRRHVAVKFIAETKGPDAVARFAREADSASKIRSPHVVRIYEHGTTSDNMPFLVMELLVGETLEKRLGRQGMLTLEDTGKVLRQVGNALDAAHARGIIHRDVKPDNIFMVDQPSGFALVKVLDFGTAKAWRDEKQLELTKTGVAVGTPEYMSPEQVLGGKDVDFRSDLWALAVVTYRMVTGHSPFESQTPHALMFTICKGDFRPLAKTPGPIELEPWFKRALEPNKERRFGSAREMVLRFEQVVAQLGEFIDDEDSYDDDASTKLLSMDAVLEQARAAGLDLGARGPTPAAASQDDLNETLTLSDDEDQLPTQQLAPEDVADVMKVIKEKEAEKKAKLQALNATHLQDELDRPPDSVTIENQRPAFRAGTVPMPEALGEAFESTVRGDLPRVPEPPSSSPGSPSPGSPSPGSPSPGSPSPGSPSPGSPSPVSPSSPGSPSSGFGPSSPRAVPPPMPSSPQLGGAGSSPQLGGAGSSPQLGGAGISSPSFASAQDMRASGSFSDPASPPSMPGASSGDSGIGPGFQPSAGPAPAQAAAEKSPDTQSPWSRPPPAGAKAKRGRRAILVAALMVVLGGGGIFALQRAGILDELRARYMPGPGDEPSATQTQAQSETASEPPASAATSAEAAESAEPAAGSASASAEAADVGYITIKCDPACVIRIGTALLGPAPLDKHEVKPGKHQVILTRHGFHPKVLQVVVAAGETAVEEVTMNIPRPRPVPAALDPAPATAPSPAPEAPKPLPQPAPIAEPPDPADLPGKDGF